MKMILVRMMSAAAVAGILSACSVTVSGGGGSGYNQAWYDVYGSYCGSGNPTAGCNFYADGSKIRDIDDPDYGPHNIFYNDLWQYTDSYGYVRFYNGSAWLSSTGILYDAYGNALNETGGEPASADVIAEVAAKEQQVAQLVGKMLAQKYALADDKGIMISQTLQDWATIGRDRSRTDADVADVSKRLYGIDANRAKGAIETALATQSQKPLDDLNVDVAAHWGTSPEVSRQILKNWYKDEVAAYGIK
jgi:hypothetical protein